MVQQIKLERDIEKRKVIVRDLWSRVCDRKKQFICCPMNEETGIKEPKESPTYLPRKGECGNIAETPIPLVGNKC